MGKIIKTKNISPSKSIIHLELTKKEAQKLKGHCKKIHLFSEDLCLHYAKIIERGAKKSAKYVSIPSILRERKHTRPLQANYQKVETDSKIFYIAVAKKENSLA